MSPARNEVSSEYKRVAFERVCPHGAGWSSFRVCGGEGSSTAGRRSGGRRPDPAGGRAAAGSNEKITKTNENSAGEANDGRLGFV